MRVYMVFMAGCAAGSLAACGIMLILVLTNRPAQRLVHNFLVLMLVSALLTLVCMAIVPF